MNPISAVIGAWLALFSALPLALPALRGMHSHAEEDGQMSRCASCNHTFSCHNQRSWDTFCFVDGCGCGEFVPKPIVT